MTDEEKVAREMFSVFIKLVTRAGFEPTDPVVGEVIASMMGAHFKFIGAGENNRVRLLRLVADAMVRAEA